MNICTVALTLELFYYCNNYQHYYTHYYCKLQGLHFFFIIEFLVVVEHQTERKSFSASAHPGLTGHIDATYSNKELNHELDNQDQQALNTSITRQVAVCMSAVQKPLSTWQQVTKQQLSQGRDIADNYEAFVVIHKGNWPVVQKWKTDFN